MIMKYTTVPCFWVEDLEVALEAHYGPKFMQEINDNHNDIRKLMFGENFMNDVCCKYYIDELEHYEGCHSLKEETSIHMNNCIRTFLRYMFPNFDYVIVDVMW